MWTGRSGSCITAALMAQHATGLVQANGAPLSDRAIQRGLRINIAAGCMGMIWGTIVAGMPLTMFMKSIGASGVMIGLTATVGQVAMALQVLSAIVAERLPSRKIFFGAALIPHRALWFIPALLPLFLPAHSPWLAPVVIWVVAISGMLGQLGGASWWSWMADLVPEGQRASFWGKRHSIISVASLFGLMAAGYLLDVFPDPDKPGGSFIGFSLVFGAAALVGTSDIVLHLWVPEPMPVVASSSRGVFQRLILPFHNRDFLWLTLAMGVWAFAAGVTGQFGLIYLNRDLEVSYSGLSILAVCGMMGASIAGILWGYVMDRIGARNFGAIMLLLAPVPNVAWFFLEKRLVAIHVPFLSVFNVSQILLALGVASILSGLIFSGVALAQVSLLPALSPKEGRTMSMAAHWSVVGLIGALGPVLGGRLMDGLHEWLPRHPLGVTLPTGLPVSFFHVLLLINAAIIWLIGLRLMLAIKQRAGEMGFRAALSTLPFMNPLRTISGIYNIYSMLSSTSRLNRADAVRRVGDDKLRIAVRDLIVQLDDASSDVREAAAIALGKIGSPDAVDALVSKLDDPQADLAPQIARALRQAGSAQAVEALIRRLNDPDRETVTETARALGDIGDARAREPLLGVLQRSRDAKVVSASSEALAHLGEMAALYEIIPRMKAATNPVLKHSLAIAVGDLLGVPGEFYQVLVREQREAGSEIERLFLALRDAIEAVHEGELESQGHQLQDKAATLCLQLQGEGRTASVADLFDLAVGLAALRYGQEFGRDAEAFVETMIWNDRRFGLAAWCLELLRDPEGGGASSVPDQVEILLGLYLLSQWSPQSVQAG